MPEVLTHKGFRGYDGLLVTKNKTDKLELTFTNEKTIKCTPEHRFMLLDGSFIEAKNLSKNHVLFKGLQVTDKKNIKTEELVYDLLNVKETNSYQTNGIESHNCVFLDEFAFVQSSIAENFFNSVYPVISSGKTTKMIIVSTPNGMNLFYKMWTDSVAKRNEYENFSIHWSMVPGRDEKFKEQTIKNTSKRQWNQEFECEFLGSTNTLIEGEKLATLAYKDRISEYSGMYIYEEPVKEAFDEYEEKQISTDHLYAICVDVSEGKNLDYSAFCVLDVSQIPYKQVAIYKSNTIPPLLFPTIIKLCAEYYNNAHVLVEINNNPQIATTLIEDLGYENVFRVSSGNKKAQTATNRSGKGVMYGLKMSPLVKRIGCSTLKTLIEHDKLLLCDFETISELTTFTQQAQSWKAEEGCNDDLVMSLVLFGWLSTQQLFKDIVSNDIRKQLQFENLSYSEDEVAPIIEPQRGFDVPYFIEDDAVWVQSSHQDCYKEIFDIHFRDL